MATFPTPPEWMRRGPLREGTFRPNLHDERTASLIGTALGVAFGLAFATGLISHYEQHPPGWLPLPTHPVWFYRFTQGVHVASGLAAIPLLLAKLWTVYPRLFSWPPVKSVLHALERLSIAVLVAGAVFELVTGLQNIAQWYPWHFPFVPAHYRVAWITVGALLLHLAVKAPAIARGLRNRPAVAEPDPSEPASLPRSDAAVAADAVPARPGAVSRRVLIGSTAFAVLAVTATTIGQSVTSLRFLDFLGVRSPHDGPQGVPINRTAAQAHVLTSAVDPSWALEVDGPRPYLLSLAELRAMPQVHARLPIACVEGWSTENQTWTGVRLADLAKMAGVPEPSSVLTRSLQKGGAFSRAVMSQAQIIDPDSLLALQVNGADLTLDHGYPARVIVPDAPGVHNTKWVSSLTFRR